MTLSVEEARLEAWQRGDLRYKLRPYQDSVHSAIWRAISDKGVLTFCPTISRRWGKTHVLCLVSNELAQRQPGAQIRFAAPTGIELRKRTLPIMRVILEDCPEHLRPRWNGQDKCWTWPNGSQLHVAGVNDGHADDLRGSGCDLAVVDEAGFVDDFEYVVNSVLMPQTLDNLGTMVASSTPPRTLAHEFYDWAMLCKDAGNYIHRDIYSTGRPAEEIKRYADTVGGFGSITWRREFLAEYVTDTQLLIVPEWKTEYIREAPKTEVRKFLHNYVALDIGVTRRDFTAVLFGHYSFPEARLYIEDEVIDSLMPRMDTAHLTAAIKGKERELWGEAAPVRMRIADNNAPELLVDLAFGGMPFQPTSKDELEAMRNKLRIWVNAGRVHVSPKCRGLIACLERGIWKNEDYIGRDFDRSTSLGHLDALAALIYLVRNVDETTNPIPRSLGFDPAHMAPPRGGFGPGDNNLAALRSAFGPKKGLL